MKAPAASFQTIDEYIAGFPHEIQEILQKFRAVVRAAAPEAEEAISYQMPTSKLHGNLVHFAANKNHLGFYPAPSGIRAFQEELKSYETAKGTIRFPFDRPIPYELVDLIVRFRVNENLEKAARKRKK